MRSSPIVAALCAAALATGSQALETAPRYTIVKEIPLGGPDKWDFLYFDGSARRVYVSHGTQVDVVDVKSDKVIGTIPGFDTSHGIVTVPALGRGYADSGNTKTVIVFDLKTLKPIATLAAGEDADAMTYDGTTKRVFVMDADGAAFTVIDAVNNKTLSTIALGGKPETAVDNGTGSIFINIASTNEVVRVNAATLAIEARWPVPACISPHGLDIDTATHRLFLSCKNDVMLIISSDDGRTVATLPIGHGTDADAFDPRRNLAFSSNGDGTLSIISELDPDKFEKLEEMPTRKGARTMTLDPETGRIYLMTGDIATLADPTAQPPARARFVPGSLNLIVLEPTGPNGH